MKTIKLFIALLLTVFFYHCNAQVDTTKFKQVSIIKRDGTLIETVIKSVMRNEINTDAGTIPIKEIRSMNFINRVKGDRSFYEKLEDNYITVKFDYIPKVGLNGQNIALLPYQNITTLNKSLNEFRIQRSTGKGMQLLGAAITGLSLGVQALYNKQYADAIEAYYARPTGAIPKSKNVPSSVYFLGVGFSIIGFGIDWSAGKHLKVKIKN